MAFARQRLGKPETGFKATFRTIVIWDNGHAFWQQHYPSWDIFEDDTEEKIHGLSSMKITMDSELYFEFIKWYGEYPQKEYQDFSEGASFCFWYYGTGDGQEVEIDISTETGGFLGTFTDDYEGWHHYRLLKAGFSELENPSWKRVYAIDVYNNVNYPEGTVVRFDYFTIEN